MKRLVVAFADVGDGVDAVFAAARSTPGRVRAALAVRRCRWIAIIATTATLVLYLLAIGDVAVGPRTTPGAGAIEVIPDWTGQLFRSRAPYLFEPVAAVYPMPGLTVLFSPINVILGGVLGGLVGLNLAASADSAARASCRPRYGSVLAAAPALLTGMACCVPAFLLAAGSGVAAALLPAVLPLRAVLYPLSLVLLGIALVWTAARAQ